MAAARNSLASDYILILRLIQPARIQDIKRYYPEILGAELDEEISVGLDRIHQKMKLDSRIIPVRRGTYILDAQGMQIAAKQAKERDIDNARMFLMKKQRREYHRFARWSG